MRSRPTFLRALLFGAALASPVPAQMTQHVSRNSAGIPADDLCTRLSISADGRIVAFASPARNLASGDTGFEWDVFARDRLTGVTQRVSVSLTGTEGDRTSDGASVSADGRFVVFSGSATNLVPGDTNNASDVFVRDLQAGTTERASVSSAGVQGNGNSYGASISADGRYVAFESSATTLVPGVNGSWQIFVRDRLSGTTEVVSVDASGTPGTLASTSASISADGRFVSFRSAASNLVPGDTNGATDVFVRDRLAGMTELVSVDSAGAQGNASCGLTAISGDGRYVAFESDATNLVPGDANGGTDVFVHDRQTGATIMADVDASGMPSNCCANDPSISSDGRYVAFESFSSNLVPGDTNFRYDAFVRDLSLGATERVSVNPRGDQGNEHSVAPWISSDGRYVAFGSASTNFVPAGVGYGGGGYVRDRFGGTAATNLCDPGSGGVLACPCSNPPSGPGRGCNNSAATGGAILSANGGAFVSSDSLYFAVTSARVGALGVLLQGTTPIAAGIVYGQGIRCVGGTLKRLFSASLVAPNTFPEYVQSTVSQRSAAKGDAIQAGQSRFYLVYYRDPIVLGGCPSASTFNATHTVQIDWAP